MATFTLSTTGAYNAAAAASGVVPVDNGKYIVANSGNADTYTLPLIAAGDAVADDFRLAVIRVGAGVKTIEASAGNTYAGDTTIGNDGDGILIFRTGDTTWGGLIQPVAAVA